MAEVIDIRQGASVLRFSLRNDDAGNWTFIRIRDRRTFSDFARRFFELRQRVIHLAEYLRERLWFISGSRPPKTLRYARKYLGDEYFEAQTDDTVSEGDDTVSEGNDSPPQSDEAQNDG